MMVPSRFNGKEVKKILVDRQGVYDGRYQTALENLPTSIIEKIKAYDEKSDLSKVTGIDDGEEQTVLDFGVKKGMNKGVDFQYRPGVWATEEPLQYAWYGWLLQ